MTEITDTDRINAIAEGFRVFQEIEISPYGGFVECWKCVYCSNGVVIAASLREAIDLGIKELRNLKKATRGV